MDVVARCEGRNASCTTAQVSTLDTDAKIESGMSGHRYHENGAAIGVISTGDSGGNQQSEPSDWLPRGCCASWMSSAVPLASACPLWSTNGARRHRACRKVPCVDGPC